MTIFYFVEFSIIINIASLGETGNCFRCAMYKLALLPPMQSLQSGREFSEQFQIALEMYGPQYSK
jgi:hypothetical protein